MSHGNTTDHAGNSLYDDAGAEVLLPDGAHDWWTIDPDDHDGTSAVGAWVVGDSVDAILADARRLNPGRAVRLAEGMVNVRLTFGWSATCRLCGHTWPTDQQPDEHDDCPRCASVRREVVPLSCRHWTEVHWSPIGERTDGPTPTGRAWCPVCCESREVVA